MSNPASAILDGLSVAGDHWRLVLAILLVVIAGQGLLVLSLRRIFSERFSIEEYFSLSLAGWLLPAALLSLLWYVGARVVSVPFGNLLLAILLLAGLLLSIQSWRWLGRSSNAALLGLVLLAMLFLALRLAYVSRAVYPLYFDSALHYQFIRELLARLPSAGAGGPAAYYHRGFHFLAAFLATLTGAQPTDTMLVLGQVILALMPFAVFFLVRHWTRSSSAAFLGLLLAAFGWYMPAHAVDWGKYPALASLGLIPFVVALAALAFQHVGALEKKNFRVLLVLLLAGAAISVLFHSRSLVVYGLLAAAGLVTWAWSRAGRNWQVLFLGLLLLAILGQVFYIRSESILGPLLDAYGRDAVLIGVVVLVLSVFAWRSFPGLLFFCLLFIALLLASLFVPLVDVIPGFARTTLLDRPYLQMLLHLPLALLGGFGLAGMQQALQGRSLSWKNKLFAWGKIAGTLLLLLAAANALRHDLYPSDCCAIVSRDDLAAIQWLDESLPAGARILAASTDLNVLPTDEYQGSAGADAGTWITPLTGRPVVYMPFNTDFSQPQVLDSLCSRQIRFLYVGKTGWFFDEAGMSAQPDHYRVLLDLPKARVYEVIGCP